MTQYTPQFVEKLTFKGSWQAVIPGMAAKAEEVKSTFFEQVRDREFSHLSISSGEIEVQKERRDYDFVEFLLDPEKDARSIMAVRLAPFAKDLFVEWRWYELGPQEGDRSLYRRWSIVSWLLIFLWLLNSWLYFQLPWWSSTTKVCLISIFLIFFALMPVAFFEHRYRVRRESLSAYQEQDSWAFKESVDQALREALDLVGISAEMIREMPEEKRAI